MTGPARARLYADRKAARRCIDCAAGLQPPDGLRCVECRERAVDDQRRYRATAKGRAAERARLARRYQHLTAAGLCVDCAAPAAPGRRRCETHLAARAASQAVYLDRKEQTHAA